VEVRNWNIRQIFRIMVDLNVRINILFLHVQNADLKRYNVKEVLLDLENLFIFVFVGINILSAK